MAVVFNLADGKGTRAKERATGSALEASGGAPTIPKSSEGASNNAGRHEGTQASKSGNEPLGKMTMRGRKFPSDEFVSYPGKGSVGKELSSELLGKRSLKLFTSPFLFVTNFTLKSFEDVEGGDTELLSLRKTKKELV